MVRVPFHFKRITEAFDEGLRLARPCQSSGSEHSAKDDFSSVELSDLINSFIEKDERPEEDQTTGEAEKMIEKEENDTERQEMLESLLGVDNNEQENEDDVKAMIRNETERIVGTMSLTEEGFKREVMSRLRINGLDAGLCKSRLKKVDGIPSGDYEYIDVIVAEARYIVEISLSTQFAVARATDKYQSLLDGFPQIFVGKPDELKQVIRLMCTAGRESMKSREMYVPPWRKSSYMVAKWFGSYKRTTNAVTSSRHASYGVEGVNGKRSVGFESSIKSFGYCRDEELMRKKVGLRVGNLAQVLNGSSN